MAAMNKRLLVILGVFVAGFGVGYALTFFLVQSPGPAPALGESPVAAVATEPTAPPAGDPAPAPEPAPTEVGTPSAAPPEPAADGGAPATDVPAEDPTPAPVEDVVAAAPVEPAAAPPEPPEEAPTPAATGPWWEVCKGRVCKADFGRVSGSVTVRKGKLEHGAEVVWRDTFANADRAGSLPAKTGLDVEVHAVGMQGASPVAAWITWRDGSRTTTGVIALNIGDKVIAFRPPEP